MKTHRAILVESNQEAKDGCALTVILYHSPLPLLDYPTFICRFDICFADHEESSHVPPHGLLGHTALLTANLWL